VIYGMEEELGIDPIRREWASMGNRGLFKFFSLERLMPILFGVGYIVFIAYQVSWQETLALVETAFRPLVALIPR
jgi:hypothetical protein